LDNIKFKRNIYNIPSIPTIANQSEEIAYFNAYLLPLAQKLIYKLRHLWCCKIRKRRLFSVNIVMNSNQKLYGNPSLTRVSTIAAGSSNVVLQDLYPVGSTLHSSWRRYF
jgi:hypothetical protein